MTFQLVLNREQISNNPAYMIADYCNVILPGTKKQNVKKKVLFILHIPPPVHGAAMIGRYIMDSKAINASLDATYINLSTSASMSEIGKGGFKKILNIIRLQGKVIKALSSKKFDGCYVTPTAAGTGFYKDLLVVIILKLFHKKIIYHFHNKGVAAKSNGRINNFFYKFAFNNTKSILLSPGLYPDFKKYLDPGNVFFCANGVPVTNLSSSAKDVSTSTGQPCQILFLSNMIIEKGVVILLEACKILKDTGNNFECHFVGAWSNMPEIDFRNLVSDYNLSGNIFVHGPKFGNDKSAFFLRADIFVLPTYYYNECFPLVLLEAMSYGLPVVSTFEGGIPDIVIDHETGFVVQQKDVASLSEKLETLIQNTDLRRQYGTAGKRRFFNLFTLEKFENNFLDIMRSCLNDTGNV